MSVWDQACWECGEYCPGGVCDRPHPQFDVHPWRQSASAGLQAAFTSRNITMPLRVVPRGYPGRGSQPQRKKYR